MLSTDILKTKIKRKLNLSVRSIIVPLGIFFLIGLIIWFHQHFFLVKDIICHQENSNCPEGVVSLIDHTKGESFIFFNQKKLRYQVLSTGLVDRVEFTLRLPGTLIVSTQPPTLSFLVNSAFDQTIPDLSSLDSTIAAAPSVELANFVATMAGKTFQLLSTGVLNQTNGDSNYFLISTSIPSRDYLSKTFNWLHSLALSSVKPDAIYFLSDMIILKQGDEPDLIMNFSADPAEDILALQRINQAITIKKPTVIDFRYSHPILK